MSPSCHISKKVFASFRCNPTVIGSLLPPKAEGQKIVTAAVNQQSPAAVWQTLHLTTPLRSFYNSNQVVLMLKLSGCIMKQVDLLAVSDEHCSHKMGVSPLFFTRRSKKHTQNYQKKTHLYQPHEAYVFGSVFKQYVWVLQLRRLRG